MGYEKLERRLGALQVYIFPIFVLHFVNLSRPQLPLFFKYDEIAITAS